MSSPVPKQGEPSLIPMQMLHLLNAGRRALVRILLQHGCKSYRPWSLWLLQLH